MNKLRLREALQSLADVLEDRRIHARILIVGGAALLLHEGLQRPTQDVDVIAFSTGNERLRQSNELPQELAEAARDVAWMHGLDDDWLNTGALGALNDLLPHLPVGFEDRARTESFGNSLLVSVLDRQDLIRLKLYAAYDVGTGETHLADLVVIRITAGELRDAATWIKKQFPEPHLGLQEIVDVLERATS